MKNILNIILILVSLNLLVNVVHIYITLKETNYPVIQTDKIDINNYSTSSVNTNRQQVSEATSSTSPETSSTTEKVINNQVLKRDDTSIVEEKLPITLPEETTKHIDATQKNTEQFTENFESTYTVEETGSMNSSENLTWWLSSGAYFYSKEGGGRTIINDLDESDSMRLEYNDYNPLDTVDGFQPQNIFRLVLKSKWENFQQENYFKIINENFGDSPYRNASNGLLHFNRYIDSNNLYYTGIRVDGQVTIKKKLDGKYSTLAIKKITDGTYDRSSSPNLLPKDTWIGLKTTVISDEKGLVQIKVYTDIGKSGQWSLAAEATDDGKTYGPAFLEAGYAGLRTDFMDVEFDDYFIKSI